MIKHYCIAAVIFIFLKTIFVDGWNNIPSYVFNTALWGGYLGLMLLPFYFCARTLGFDFTEPSRARGIGILLCTMPLIGRAVTMLQPQSASVIVGEAILIENGSYTHEAWRMFLFDSVLTLMCGIVATLYYVRITRDSLISNGKY